MPTPPKPAAVLEAEKKSHRTKAELEMRKEGEAAVLTGKPMKERPEVKANPTAHKEYLRLNGKNGLLKAIDKDDAIYEPVINRYCMLQGECADFEEQRNALSRSIEELEQDKEELLRSGETTLTAYYKLRSSMQANMISLDRQIQAKRKMMFDIERENAMTIAAALRSIPKKTEPEDNELLKALGRL